MHGIIGRATAEPGPEVIKPRIGRPRALARQAQTRGRGDVPIRLSQVLLECRGVRLRGGKRLGHRFRGTAEEGGESA